MPKAKRSEPWSVYIVECANQALYTGIAKDVLRRLATHNAGRGAKYTRTFGPVELRWTEKHKGFACAAKREAQIKRWPREKKLELIQILKTKVVALVPGSSNGRMRDSPAGRPAGARR